jgi:hypothetical protein
VSRRALSLALALGLGLGAALLCFYESGAVEIGVEIEPRRVVAALLAVGFFWAPESHRPLDARLWLLGAALAAWGARTASLGAGGFPLWAASSLGGAFLTVRGGSRAARHILPEAGSEEGEKKRRAIRRELRIAAAFFLAGSLLPRTVSFAAALSAAFFIRYALLQSKFLGVVPVPLSRSAGIVPAQKWAVLALFVFLGGTSYPAVLLGEGGEGTLLVTAALCSMLASLVFVLALTRSGWPKAFVRRASFVAGLGLAVVLTAVLASLESWDAERYAVFTSASTSFLVVLPFVKATTRLFDSYPRAGFLVPPAVLAAMMAPVTAMNVNGWGTSPPPPMSAAALYAFSLLMLVYQLAVTLRERASGRLYLAVLLGSMVFLVLHPGAAGSTKIFVLSLGLVLYAVDLFDRLWRMSRPRERIREP